MTSLLSPNPSRWVRRGSCGGLLILLLGCQETSEPATLVLRGGIIRTLDAENTKAEALAVRGEDIVFVGSTQDATRYIGESTTVVELAGQTVLPGFIDAHTHLIWSAADLLNVDLFDITTTDALQTRVLTWAEAHPEAEWVTGGGWSMSAFEGLLEKSLLDEVVPDRPVLLYSADGHTAFVNSLALELAGISADTPDPEDGWIEHDETGEPTGILQESAMDLVWVLIPYPSDAQTDEGLTNGLREANGFGITSIVDAGVDDWMLSGYARADAQGTLTVRVQGAVVMEPGDSTNLERLTSLHDRYQSEHLSVSSAKFFVDGIIEAQTAYMIEPYTDGTNAPPAFSDEELQAAALAVDEAGFQLHAHVIGDGAVRQFLDALEVVEIQNGLRDRRALLAHLEVIDPDDLPRFAALGAYADFQPLWAYPEEYIRELTWPVIGEERSESLYPLQAVLDAGGALVAGSDWSVSSMNPLEAIEVAVTRQDPWADGGDVLTPQHRVGVEDALRAYTSEAARAIFSEDRLGTLEVGKLADLVVLETDPLLVQPHALSDIRVLQTYLGGTKVFGWTEDTVRIARPRRSHAAGCR